MGLDMYLYGLKKMTAEEIADWIQNDTNKKGQYHVTRLNDVPEHNAENISELVMPYFTPVSRVEPVYNTKKLKEKFHVKDDAYVNYENYANGNYIIRFSDGTQIDMESDEAKACIEDTEMHYLIAWERKIDYWRKNYPLQDYIYNSNSDRPDNTKYVQLDGEILDSIYEENVPEFADDEIPVYWEWY